MRFRPIAALFALPVVALIACEDDTGPLSPRADAGSSSGGVDASSDGSPGADAGGDAAVADVCAVEKQHGVDCGLKLECGDKFDAWCKEADKIDSEQRRSAKRACLTKDRCATADARDCIFKTYNKATRTAAQEALLDAYCNTCFTGGGIGLCKAASPAYDTSKGPAGVTDIFLAVWELSDTLTDKIRTTCTGGALDAGAADAGDGGGASSCAAAFASCAGGIYVDALPLCP